jgi:hypothetical protein
MGLREKTKCRNAMLTYGSDGFSNVHDAKVEEAMDEEDETMRRDGEPDSVNA